MQPEKTVNYSYPNKILANQIYLQGLWKSNPDDLQLESKNGLIILDFVARSVNIVADNLENPVEVEVLIDGDYITRQQAGTDVRFEEERAFILVDTPQLYNIVEGDYGNYELTLRVTSSNFTFNAFTFG